MQDLDALQLKIIGDVSKATDALDGLIGKLEALNHSLHLNNVNFLTQQLDSIAASSKGVDARNLKATASSLDALNKAALRASDGFTALGTAEANAATKTSGNVYGGIVEALNSIQNVTLPDFSGLTTLANGLKSLSSINTGKITEIANALRGIGEASTSGASSLGQTASDIASIANNASASTVPMQTMANEAANAGNSVALLVDKMYGFNQFASSMGTTADMFERISRTLSMGMFSQLSTALLDLGSNSSIPKLEGDIIDVTDSFKELSTEIVPLRDALNDLGSSTGLTELGSTAIALSDNSAGVRTTTQNIRELSTEVESFVDIVGNGTSRVQPLDHILIDDPSAIRNVNNELGEIANHVEEAGNRAERTTERVKRNSIDILAYLVTLGHEISKLSNMLGHIADQGIKVLRFAFKPLDNTIREYKEKIESLGNAFKNLAQKGKKHLDNLSRFWKRTMKTFTFMLVRKAITAVLSEVTAAVQSLAKWSKEFGTIFNDSMSHITSDFSYMARAIVGAFEPLINAITPILNMLADAFANLAAKVGEFFAALTGQGYYMKAKKQVVDYSDSVEKAQKQQKNLIAGLDDLNVITTPTATESGMDDVAEQWEKIDVSDKMKDIADKVKDFASKLFDPIKKAWDRAGQHVIDGWKYMTGELKKLGASIARDFWKVWQQENTVKIFENLFHTIGYIEEGIGHLARNFRKAWDENETGLHILENIRDIVLIITEHVKNMAKEFRDWADKLDFSPLLTSFEEFTRKVQPLVDFLGQLAEEIWQRVILEHWRWLIEEGLPHLLKTIGKIIDAFDFDKILEDLKPVLDAFERMRQNIETGITDAIGNLGLRIAEFANSEDFTHFCENVAWFMDQITAERVEKLFTALGTAILDIAEALMKFVGSDDFKDFIQKLLDWYDSKSAEEIAGYLTDIAKAIALFKFAQFVGGGVAKFFEFLAALKSLAGVGGASKALTISGASIGSLGTALGVLAAIAVAIYSIVKSFGGLKGVLDELKKHFGMVFGFIKKTIEDSGIGKSFSRLKDSIKKLLDTLGNMKSFWQAVFYVIDALVILLAQIAIPVFRTVIDIISGIVDWLSGLFDVLGGVFDILKGIFTGDGDLIVSGAQRIVDGIVGAFGGLGRILGAIFQGIIDIVLAPFKAIKYFLLGDPIVIDICEGVLGWFGDMVAGIVEFVGGIVGKVVGFFKDMKDKALEKVREWKEKLDEKWEQFKTAASETWRNIKEKAVEGWEKIKEEVKSKVERFREDVAQKWEEFKTNASETWKNIKEDALTAWDNIKKEVKKKVEKFREAIETKWGEFRDNAVTAWENIKNDAGEWWNDIKKDVTDIAENLRKDVEDKWKEVKKNAVDAWTQVKKDANDWWTKIKDTIVGFAKGIKNDLFDWWEKVKTDAHNAWTNFCEDASTMWNNIKDTIVGKAGEIFGDLQQKWADIKSDAEDWWGKINESASGWWSDISGTISGALDGLRGTISDIWDGIASDANTAWSNILDGLGTIAEKIGDTVSGAISGVQQLAEDVKETASNVASNAKTAVGNAANTVKTGVNNVVSKVSTTVSNTVAKTGVTASVKESADNIIQSAKDMVEDIKNVVSDITKSGKGITKQGVNALFNQIETVQRKITQWKNDAESESTKSQLQSMFDATNSIKKAFENAARGGNGIVQSMVSGLVNAVHSALPKITGAASTIANQLINGTEKLLRINSPSKVFYEIGENVVAGLNNAILDGEDSTQKVVGDWVKTIEDFDVPQFDIESALPKNVDFSTNVGYSGNMAFEQADLEESVRSGVAEAIGGLVLPYLNSIAESSRETANKKFGITSREAFDAVRTEARNYNVRTGREAFAY